MSTTRVHHVALVDRGRVLLGADGALPRFVHDRDDEQAPDPTAHAEGLVGGAVAHLAPVLTLPEEGGRLHVLSPREDMPDGPAWRAVRALDEPCRSLVAGAFEQYVGQPPALRPEWFRPGWHDRVEAWVDESLQESGRRRTGRLRTHRVWSISAVMRVPTDAGELWFKACCDHFRAEAGILRRLSTRLPDLVPVVVAAHDDAGWLLMEPLAGAADSDRAPGAPDVLATLWTEAQLASLEWLDDLTAAGCPDRTLEPTLAAWREVLAHSPEMDRLTVAERAAVLGVAGEAEARVREFWACGIPDTLSHGDLHLGNVAYDGTSLRLFDWTDACVTHPFLDASHLAYFVASGSGPEADRVASLLVEPWRRAFPDADVDRALQLAPLADLVFQSVTFAGIDAATEEGSGDFTGTVAHLSRAIARTLGALPD